MGKIINQGPKEALKKPVTKSITKLQRLKKMSLRTKKLKNKLKEENEEIHDNIGTQDIPEEVLDETQENPEEVFDQEQEETKENINEQEEEENMDLEDGTKEEEKENNRAGVKQSSNLVKVMNPTLESRPIYTGGKIALSTSENELYCLCNNEIVVYCLETQTIKQKITQENEEIANFVLHPSNKSIVYFTKNFLLRHVLLEDKSVLRLWKVQNQYVLDLSIDTSGRLLAIGSTNGAVQVFDLKSGNTTHMFTNNKGPIVRLAFHPHPQKLYLVSLSEDLTLRIFDLVVNSCVKIFQNFQSNPSNLTILDDGINLLTASFDLKINLYDLQQLKHMTSFSLDEEIIAIENIKLIHPKTKDPQTFLLLGGQSGVLKTLNLSLDKPDIKPHAHIKSEPIVQIIKFKKGNRIALITAEQNITILTHTLNSKGDLEFKQVNLIPGYNDEVIDIKFQKKKQTETTPQDLDYFAYCTNSAQIRVYYPKQKKTDFLWGHEDIVLCLDTHGDYIASGSKDNTIKLWHYQKGDFKLISTFKGHNESVGTISFAPVKGNYLLSGSADKTLKLWNIAALKKKAVGSESEEISSAKNTILAHDKDINCAKFSPNEKLIASASQDRTIKIFQRDGLRPQNILKGHKRGVWDIAFSPVEKLIASSSGDNTVKIWNLVDGLCIKTLEGHTSPVLKVEWICYGLEIVSASADGLLKIWNLKKMACVNTLEKHEGKVWSLSARVNTETGRYEILSGDNDSTWILWEDQTQEDDQAKKEAINMRVLQDQQLYSLVRENKYLEAGKLSFDLNMTRSYKQMLETLLNKAEFQTHMIYSVEEEDKSKGANGKAQMQSDFKKLVEYCLEKDMKKLYTIIRDLNTTAKFARIAQRMLEIVLENINFEDLDQSKKSFNAEEGDKNLQGFMEILLSYSERHFGRVQKSVTKSFYLDYIMKHSFLINSGAESDVLQYGK